MHEWTYARRLVGKLLPGSQASFLWATVVYEALVSSAGGLPDDQGPERLERVRFRAQ